jgi:hypothetical protein
LQKVFTPIPQTTPNQNCHWTICNLNLFSTLLHILQLSKFSYFLTLNWNLTTMCSPWNWSQAVLFFSQYFLKIYFIDIYSYWRCPWILSKFWWREYQSIMSETRAGLFTQLTTWLKTTYNALPCVFWTSV